MKVVVYFFLLCVLPFDCYGKFVNITDKYNYSYVLNTNDVKYVKSTTIVNTKFDFTDGLILEKSNYLIINIFLNNDEKLTLTLSREEYNKFIKELE